VYDHHDLEEALMHAIHPDRRVLLAALVAFVCALAAAAAVPSLPELEFGGGGAAAPASAPAQTATPTTDPVWAKDPVAPPALLRD
jgi:hypothetical protein